MTSELALPTAPPSVGRESELLRRVIRALEADRIVPADFARDLLVELDELERAAREPRDSLMDEVVRCPHCAGAVVVDVARRVRRRRGRHP